MCQGLQSSQSVISSHGNLRLCLLTPVLNNDQQIQMIDYPIMVQVCRTERIISARSPGIDYSKKVADTYFAVGIDVADRRPDWTQDDALMRAANLNLGVGGYGAIVADRMGGVDD